MKLIPGLVSATFKDRSVEEVIALAVKAGLKAIEWSEGHHVPVDNILEAGRIGALTAISGLKTAEYGSYYKLGMGMDIEPRLHAAQALGTNIVRIWAGEKASSAVSAAERKEMIDEARMIADKAAESGLTIVLEWHKNTLTDTNDSGLDFIDEVCRDNFRTLWQPSMLMDVPERVRGIQMLGDRIINLHVFYWDSTGRRPLSEGQTDWKSYSEALPEDWEGYALLEFVKDNTTEQFVEDASVLHQWIG